MSTRGLAAWSVLLAAALAAIVWQAVHPAGMPAHDDDDEHAAAPRLHAVPEAQWSAVELVGAAGVHRFERDGAGRWLLHDVVAGEAPDHAHRADDAAAQRIAEAFGTFSRTAIERELGADAAGRLADYGLDRPPLIVLVRGADGRPLLTLEAGAVAPDGLGRYVRLPRDGSVLVIPNYQIEGLLALTRVPAVPASGARP